MAGDWIKVEHVTPDKPEVYRIADAIGLTPDGVLGALIRLWIWADQQSLEGNAVSVTKSAIDARAGVTGFADAMCLVGWLEADDAGVRFINLDRHISQTAKRRALTARRVADCKRRKANAHSVTTALPREEKRRVLSAPASAGATEQPTKPKSGRKRQGKPDALKHSKHFFDGWGRRWREAYQRDPPKVEPKDGVAATAIVKALGDDPRQIDLVLDAYFADTGDFFAGHPITKLKSQLERFVAKAGDHGKRSKPSAAPGIYGDQGW